MLMYKQRSMVAGPQPLPGSLSAHAAHTISAEPKPLGGVDGLSQPLKKNPQGEKRIQKGFYVKKHNTREIF